MYIPVRCPTCGAYIGMAAVIFHQIVTDSINRHAQELHNDGENTSHTHDSIKYMSPAMWSSMQRPLIAAPILDQLHITKLCCRTEIIGRIPISTLYNT
jgi:DNA-directed RNA polymerase subunit N (RpoN/RPB10)